MTAETRLAVVLVGSFLLWSPALPSLLQGGLDVGAAGVRLAGAVAVTWMATTLLDHVVGGYHRAAEEGATDLSRQDQGDGGRRAEDLDPATPSAAPGAVEAEEGPASPDPA
jgi:hypothetical protein